MLAEAMAIQLQGFVLVAEAHQALVIRGEARRPQIGPGSIEVAPLKRFDGEPRPHRPRPRGGAMRQCHLPLIRKTGWRVGRHRRGVPHRVRILPVGTTVPSRAEARIAALLQSRGHSAVRGGVIARAKGFVWIAQ
jgi:hypothetical protein